MVAHRGQNNQCAACRHPERARIDFLIASGATKRSLALRFKLHHDCVLRHAKNHVPESYKKAVAIGPFKSEAELRRLTAENSTSVVQNLQALYGGLASRWLACLEAGADNALISISKEMHRNLDLRARISRELTPAGTTIVNTIFQLQPVIELERTLMRVLSEYPDAKAAVIRELRAIESKADGKIIEVPNDPAAAAA